MIIDVERDEFAKFSVRLDLQADLSRKDEKKVEMAVNHMADALSSEEFYNWCMSYNYWYSYRKWKWFRYKTYWQKVNNFKMSNGLSRKGIYNKLMTGSETLQPTPDNEADMTLHVDYSHAGNVIGYTYSNTVSQWIYYSWFSNNDFNDVAGNLAHEWAHKMGFNHDFNWNNTREFTVPYAVGYFVRDFDA